MTKEQDLRERLPFIEWDEPAQISTPHGAGYACRFCIAFYGIKGSDFTPHSYDQVVSHIADVHG